MTGLPNGQRILPKRNLPVGGGQAQCALIIPRPVSVMPTRTSLSGGIGVAGRRVAVGATCSATGERVGVGGRGDGAVRHPNKSNHSASRKKRHMTTNPPERQTCAKSPEFAPPSRGATRVRQRCIRHTFPGRRHFDAVH